MLLIIKISSFIQKYSTCLKSKVRDLSKFDGTYFHVWKCKIQLYLNSEKLKDIVGGAKILPSTPLLASSQQSIHKEQESKEEWDSLNAEALCIIKICLDNNQEVRISTFTLASKVCSNLLWLFESNDHIIQMYLKDKLAT
jgi:hypothetical protein